MITLYWKRKHTSELDKRIFAQAIGQIIPILLGSHKVVKGISKNITIDTRDSIGGENLIFSWAKFYPINKNLDYSNFGKEEKEFALFLSCYLI